MEKYDIYGDISRRTGGEIFIGVVGPVRTGKSTFITKFTENFILPNIGNKLQRQIALDEMPQSADGRTVMTTQPKFIPANGVKVQFKNKVSANVRLVDCVGYLVEGATGHEEDGAPRLVKTPWSDTEMTFEKAAEFGTEKVIDEYSTIGLVITTDGSFGEIPRENYVSAEDKVIRKLQKQGKPFVIILNSADVETEKAIDTKNKLEEKYGVSVVLINVLKMTADDISDIMEKILLEFPMQSFNVDLPKWMQALPSDSPIISRFLAEIKKASEDMCKMRDFSRLLSVLDGDNEFNGVELTELNLANGVGEYKASVKDGVFYKILSEECGEEISDDYGLMSYIKSFSASKRKFNKIKEALEEAEEKGYGVVLPSFEEMNLEEPALVKQGGRFGVKLKASAPSLHIMKVDVSTEVSPIVGTEKQGEDLINFIMNKFEDNPAGIWETNMFGKSLHDLVKEGMAGKVNAMPKEAQNKIRKTLTRIINENKGGLLCILL
ncbi:MAG: stage IV sporulation protein A [Clostridia bacterium]|nr:stage IV sporulation protein A [Clostridia bacterium]